MFNLFLITHIVTGLICLISGIFAMSSKKKKGKHSISGEIYHWSYFLVFTTTVIISIIHWEDSAYLFYVGVFSYGLALLGYLAGKIKWKNWLSNHIGGMLGSYIGIVTATLVVNSPKVAVLNEIPVLILWFLPTIVGTPFIYKVGVKYKSKLGKERSTPI